MTCASGASSPRAAASAMTLAMWAWVVLDLDQRQAVCLRFGARPLAGEIAGVTVAGKRRRRDVKEPLHARAARLPGVKVSAFSRSPICCETRHSAVPSACSRVRASVAFCTGPQGEDGGKGRPVVRRVRGAGCVADCGARIISSVGPSLPVAARWAAGRSRGRGVPSGPFRPPRAPRSRQSERGWHGCCRGARRQDRPRPDGAMRARRPVSMGSSLTLPLVMTSERTPRSAQAASRRCWSGV